MTCSVKKWLDRLNSIFFFIDEVATALLRSLSPAKKDEPTEAVDFLNSFLSHVKSEEKPTLVFPSREDSKPTLSFDGKDLIFFDIHRDSPSEWFFRLR